MRVVRRNSWEQGLRIAYVAPCYIKSAIRTAEWEAKLLAENAPFGESDDVAACMARIATDETINGMYQPETATWAVANELPTLRPFSHDRSKIIG